MINEIESNSSIPVALNIKSLKSRQDFLYLRNGWSYKTKFFVFVAKETPCPLLHEESITARIGFTVTKKCGNAVTRNKIKRRLKEATRQGLHFCLLSGYDYNIIGYKTSLELKFDQLVNELKLCCKYHKDFLQKSKKS